MATTLKEQREKRRVKALQEKLVRLDQQLTEERLLGERFNLLLEEIDEEELAKVSSIIEKLRAIQQNVQQSDVLKTAVEKALMDLQKVTGGDSSTWTQRNLPTILKKINRGENAEILKNAMGLVSALETGMRLMPQLLKNMLGGIQGGSEDAELSVAALLTKRGEGATLEGTVREAPEDAAFSAGGAKPGEGQAVGERWKAKSTGEAGSPKFDLLVKNISKAMKPSKWFGLAQGKVPYVSSAEDLVRDLLSNVPVGTLMQLTQTVTGGAQASNVAQDIADGGVGEPKGTEGTRSPAPSTGTVEKGTEPTQRAGEPAAEPSRMRIADQGPETKPISMKAEKALVTKLANQGLGVEPEAIAKVVKALAVMNKLVESNSKTLGPATALELLKELARSDALADAIEERIVRIQLDESDIRHLIRELERLPPQS